MLQRLLALIAALAAISAVSSSAARADQRVALVIGVAAYDEAEPLLNPVRDAEAVAARFRSLGYETRLFLNASRAEMTAALAALGKGEGALDQAVIYFAGHGVQVDGANDLLPADWAADRPLDETGLSLREIARAAAGAARQTIFMIDACRDNLWDETEVAWGFENFVAGVRAAAPRTAVMKAGMARLPSDTLPPNSIFSFSALPGHFAYDGDGPISDYAAAFVKHAAQPQIGYAALFALIADEVSRKSGGDQFPQVISQLTHPAIVSRNAPQLPAPSAGGEAGAPYGYERRSLHAALQAELEETWPRSAGRDRLATSSALRRAGSSRRSPRRIGPRSNA